MLTLTELRFNVPAASCMLLPTMNKGIGMFSTAAVLNIINKKERDTNMMCLFKKGNFKYQYKKETKNYSCNMH